jgi:uncharacterized protein
LSRPAPGLILLCASRRLEGLPAHGALIRNGRLGGATAGRAGPIHDKEEIGVNLFEGCHDKSLASGLQWLNEPPEWSFDAGGLTVFPAAATDFFRPPDRPAHDSAGLLYGWVEGDFTATTRASAALAGFGDAAALTVRGEARTWAKLCVERSPVGEVSIVSVVTQTWSDDANNELLARPEAFLRLTRNGPLFGMHYSLDGRRWRFVRAFALPLPHRVMVGVHAQAPFQGGCRASFAFLDLAAEPVGDFRSGE